jgi:hypothetical protein
MFTKYFLAFEISHTKVRVVGHLEPFLESGKKACFYIVEDAWHYGILFEEFLLNVFPMLFITLQSKKINKSIAFRYVLHDRRGIMGMFAQKGCKKYRTEGALSS